MVTIKYRFQGRKRNCLAHCAFFRANPTQKQLWRFIYNYLLVDMVNMSYLSERDFLITFIRYLHIYPKGEVTRTWHHRNTWQGSSSKHHWSLSPKALQTYEGCFYLKQISQSKVRAVGNKFPSCHYILQNFNKSRSYGLTWHQAPR